MEKGMQYQLYIIENNENIKTTLRHKIIDGFNRVFFSIKDAPMRFLYCVRAAHLPVPNIEQSAVIYDLPPSRFQTNSQLVCASDSTDQEQDQSSDADSEARSDRTREPEINGSVTRMSRDEPINSTSDEPR